MDVIDTPAIVVMRVAGMPAIVAMNVTGTPAIGGMSVAGPPAVTAAMRPGREPARGFGDGAVEPRFVHHCALRHAAGRGNAGEEPPHVAECAALFLLCGHDPIDTPSPPHSVSDAQHNQPQRRGDDMNILKKAVAGALLTAVSVTGAWADSADPIKIPINEWTGQHISAHITGSLLQKAGYTIEYVTAGAVPQFAAIAQGDLHVQPETWTNNVGDIYPKAVESGDIVVLGSLGLKPQEGWIYPPYMNEKCPGLPSYDALYDCAQAFAAADTFPKGRLITYPADWGTRSKDVVAQIGIPFEPVAGGSEGAMIAELKSAVAAEQPIIMMFWQPHWIHAETTFDWVGWDAADGECVEESGQSRGTACGFQQATIDKIVNKDFAAKWPGAYKLLEVISIDNAAQNVLMLEIDNKGRKIEEVIAEWVDANEATWGPWVEAAKAAMSS